MATARGRHCSICTIQNNYVIYRIYSLTAYIAYIKTYLRKIPNLATFAASYTNLSKGFRISKGKS